MKKNILLAGLVFSIAYLILPGISLASSVKTLSGNVLKINGSSVVFSNSTAATYAAEVGSAVLTRKNGAPMLFSEILPGDKIEVKGTLWGDNSISASSLRNLSLYAHNSTFSGKVTGIDPASSSFTLESKTYGTQTIRTNNFTAFSVNGKNAGFANVALGMTVTTKGMWDRSTTNVVASKVTASFRLINIYFTGTLSMKSPDSLTVIGNGNVIYGINISNTILENKSGAPINLSQINLGDNLRVWGKHVSGTVAIMGTKVKDSSISK